MTTLTPEEREKLYAMIKGDGTVYQFLGWITYEASHSGEVAASIRRFMADVEKQKKEEPVLT